MKQLRVNPSEIAFCQQCASSFGRVWLRQFRSRRPDVLYFFTLSSREYLFILVIPSQKMHVSQFLNDVFINFILNRKNRLIRNKKSRQHDQTLYSLQACRNLEPN